MKLTVVGVGYVGLSLATLISRKYEVTAIDTDITKVKAINNRRHPFKDEVIEKFHNKYSLKLKSTSNKKIAYKRADYIIIATPTNYDNKNNLFDTSSIEKVIEDIIKINNIAQIVIKSTIPIGYTDHLKKKYNKKNIFFSPEFLREGKALHDNLYPSRIIVGDTTKEAHSFMQILAECAFKQEKKITKINMSSKEAEAVKLFANTYLAMRVSFFNELDSFSQTNRISTENIINGVSSDPRIGDYYNNPSFGYGGYCLPKDSKQLLANFNNVPNRIIKAVVEANKTRKKFILKSILSKKPKIVGIFRIVMKNGSDNYRESAIIEIIQALKKKKIKIIIYEPSIKNIFFDEVKVINDIDKFIKNSDIIVANRNSKILKSAKNKVYTRDLFNRD